METEAGVGFLNQAQTGGLKIVKTADDDKIEGRAFKVTGTDFMGNSYEQEFQTDENGEIRVDLRVGEYTVSELTFEDSENYILPDDQTIEIKAGETIVVEMHNQLVPEQPDIPQTGDSSNLPLIYVGLTAAGAGSLLLILTLYHRKKSIKGSNK